MESFKEAVYVTSPLLPPLEEVQSKLAEIWQSGHLTNHGKFHNELEARLEDFLKVNNVSLFNNGTIALTTALKAFAIPLGNEVITTPFTFPATPHSISWNGLKPVFCDIEPETMTIDPERIESSITPKTSAILGVHVYGFPCKVEEINNIAKRHGLRVIYDAAHAFTTEIDGKPITDWGDISALSFHATKLFNTIEGGALVYSEPGLREICYSLRNFGIKNEEEIVSVGINGKMNELQAALGLLNLDLVRKEHDKRRLIDEMYRDMLSFIPGITVPKMPEGVSSSYQYFPILVDREFGCSRDELYKRLKDYNVYSRKYFYPLCSQYEPYRDFPSSSPENLPNAHSVANRVLCLPFYGKLTDMGAEKICNIIKLIYQKVNVGVIK